MSGRSFEAVVEAGLPTVLPSGASFPVLTQDEVDYVEERVARYLADNHFVNVADFQDIDRMVMFELLVHRWTLWLSRGKDYFDDEIDEKSYRSSVDDYSTQIRQIKKSLGIDKVTRDKTKGDDSVQEYLAQLRVRAKEFGVMREGQLNKALELFNQLKMLVTLYDNCDEDERREMHCTMDDVFEWMRTVAFPEYDAIDAHFREHQQRFWVRRQ